MGGLDQFLVTRYSVLMGDIVRWMDGSSAASLVSAVDETSQYFTVNGAPTRASSLLKVPESFKALC